MTVGNLRLFEGTIPASETTVYTNNTGRPVIMKNVLVDNVTGTAAIYSMSIVPVGGTAGIANRLAVGVSVALNAQSNIDYEQVIQPGEFISMIQTTAGALTALITGAIVPA